MTKKVAAANPTEKTAKRILVDWANGQDGWIRTIVNEVLASGNSLVADSIYNVYDQFLIEKGLKEGNAQVVPPILLGDESSESQSVLRLVRLEDVKGVNALAADQKISFNSGVTVVFGENGAGKTGYTRILKRAASARSAEPIINNVHEVAITDPPSATLTWTIDDVEESESWTNQLGFGPLVRIDVFDSPSVVMHLDTDLSYSYVPADLALFKHVNSAIKSISERAESEIQAKTSQGNTFLQIFERGSEIYPLIETLSSASDLDKLRTLGTLSEEEEATLPDLKAKVLALQSDNIQAQITVARSRLTANSELLGLITALRGFNEGAYSQAISDLSQARIEQTALELAISTEYAIPGADSAPWREFVNAGDKYRAHLELHEDLATADLCLYCRQSLAGKALELVIAYKNIANNSFQTSIDSSLAIAGQIAKPIVEKDVDRLVKLFNDLGDEPDHHNKGTLTLLELVSPLQKELSAIQAIEIAKVLAIIPSIEDEAGKRVSASTDLLNELGSRVEERRQLLVDAQANERNLVARIRLKSNLEGIESFIGNAKWVTGLKTVTSRFPATQTSLTLASKEASQRLLNDNFDIEFKEECKNLRAPEVQLDFPGRDGASRRVKTVITHKPSEILSEGEQKVIALADFLAESSLRGASSPVIFDDPVNSLDYKRIKEVAARIAKLSQQRQVVVFTHNIWFATELISQFEKQKHLVSYYSIDDDGPIKGIVSGGTHPRWDTVSKMTGKINEMIQAARASEGEVREALIERAYSSIRAWIEVVVEQEVLARVVQRYEPNIMITRLPQIDGTKLEVIKTALIPLYEKACRIMEGHSQPLETLSVRPNLNELEGEWSAATAARATYIG